MNNSEAEKAIHLGFIAAMMRVASGISLLLAAVTAALLVALRVIHFFRPDLLPWHLKSAVPLILIGFAFACLQCVVPRTRSQIALGLMVASAFILWGTEQFLSNQTLVAFIDDIVVFLFVLDLGLVTYGHLKPAKPPVKNVKL